CSEMKTPGVLVGIAANEPRIAWGALGFGSQVSSWLGPPHWKIRMHALARPNPAGRRALPPGPSARARSNPGRPKPVRVSAPPRRASLGLAGRLKKSGHASGVAFIGKLLVRARQHGRPYCLTKIKHFVAANCTRRARPCPLRRQELPWQNLSQRTA